ncbi:hypothetical protein EXIGLDRAFT_774904 [Exidia glandulosa HHB12029]|uniref:Uncharacterized protein n=1 Tax=Exidia glandulosa HHB12029 TaxID=1314781 RepID=A0A165E5Q7_EXIGL|nr:hypothetical protein EXIGLDRAFT_774904 [Exidia glandulosa HHB12029]
MSSSDASSVIDAETMYGLGPNLHAMIPDDVRVQSGDPAPAPFVQRTRYAIVCAVPGSESNSVWVSLNAPHPGFMPFPRVNGPVDCYCINHFDGLGHLGRYGTVPNVQPSLFYPDWLGQPTDNNYARMFIPDLFSGEGPCPQKDIRGLLHQFDPNWIEYRDGAPRFTDEIQRAFRQDVVDTDDQLRDALGLAESAYPSLRPHIPNVAATIANLYSDWGSFVLKSLERCGHLLRRAIGGGEWVAISHQFPGLHESLRESHYLFPPRGVWVRETNARVLIIKELIRVGVPVYYRWEPSFLNLPAARSLAPPSGLWMPPTYVPRAISNVSSPTSSVRSFAAGSSFVSITASTPSTPQRASPATPLAPPPPCTSCDATHTLGSCAPIAGAERAASDSSSTPVLPGAFQEPEEDEVHDSDDEAMAALDIEALRASGHDNNSANLSLPHNARASAPPRWFAVDTSNDQLSDKPENAAREKRINVEVAPDTPPPEQAELPVRRTLAERLIVDAPLPPRRIPTRGRPVPRLWICDRGRAMEALAAEESKGFTNTAMDIIYVAIARGLKFSTPVEVKEPQANRTRVNHDVRASWMLDNNASVKEKVERWQFGCMKILQRPHVVRAAIMAGGILARIAKHFLFFDEKGQPKPHVTFKVGPTRAVVDYGIPLLRRTIRSDEEVLHDDYLGANEIYVLLGAEVTRKDEDVVIRSFWPTERKMLIEGYDSVWSQVWEDWFSARLTRILLFQQPPIANRYWGELRPVADHDA